MYSIYTQGIIQSDAAIKLMRDTFCVQVMNDILKSQGHFVHGPETVAIKNAVKVKNLKSQHVIFFNIVNIY